MRVVPANKLTGGIDPDEVVKYVDKDTCLLSIMSASNISGTNPVFPMVLPTITI